MGEDVGIDETEEVCRGSRGGWKRVGGVGGGEIE